MKDIRIHTVGASGSGTTTLANALATQLKLPQFDADSYYWEPTNPPFTIKRPPELRISMLEKDLNRQASWVLSGSVVNWGESLQDQFTHIVFITLPPDVRIDRVRKRERERFGSRIQPNGDMYQQHLDFIAWAQKYDIGGSEVRSRQLHEAWFKTLSCRIIRISGEMKTEDQVQSVLMAI